MNQSDSNLNREAFVFMKREEQNYSRMFLTEEEYYTVPAKSPGLGVRDTLMLNFGNWLIKVGNDLKPRTVCTNLSEKQV